MLAPAFRLGLRLELVWASGLRTGGAAVLDVGSKTLLLSDSSTQPSDRGACNTEAAAQRGAMQKRGYHHQWLGPITPRVTTRRDLNQRQAHTEHRANRVEVFVCALCAVCRRAVSCAGQGIHKKKLCT